jgi:hypothetical protein
LIQTTLVETSRGGTETYETSLDVDPSQAIIDDPRIERALDPPAVALGSVPRLPALQRRRRTLTSRVEPDDRGRVPVADCKELVEGRDVILLLLLVGIVAV